MNYVVFRVRNSSNTINGDLGNSRTETAETRGNSVRVCTNKITRVTLYLARNYGKQCSLEKSPLRCNYRNGNVRYVEKRKYTERKEYDIVSETTHYLLKSF